PELRRGAPRDANRGEARAASAANIRWPDEAAGREDRFSRLPGGPAAMTSAPPSERDRTFREEALPQMDAVYRFALRLTRDDERARDLVQETYLRAWQNWDRYTPGTRAKSWLFTISRNAFLRAEERTRRHTEIVAAESSAGGTDEGGVPTVFRS